MLNKKAFTLIELLVVISIISLLATVILGALGGAREKAKIVRAQQDMREIYNAFSLYENSYGYGPKGNSGSTSQWGAWNKAMCDGDHTIGSGANDPDEHDRPNQAFVGYFETELSEYISEIPKDPWGNRYVIDAVYSCHEDSSGGCEGTPDPSDTDKFRFCLCTCKWWSKR
jgi:prepilin-type N-terminal cleavage/methylation domain-containing protein